MRQAGEEPRSEQRAEARRERGTDAPEDEDDHEAEQQPPPVHLRPEHRDERRADDHAERVERDRVAGFGQARVEAGGDLREQTHGGELCGADAEGADREREHGEAGGHGSSSGGDAHIDRRARVG